MTPVTSNVQTIVNDIVELIENDSQIEHCRINIVNGYGDVFTKYKNNLKAIEDKEHISVRFYNDVIDLNKDIFRDDDFMAEDWFNLFAFNLNYCNHICINRGCDSYGMEVQVCDKPYYCVDATCIGTDSSVRETLMNDIRGIDFIVKELRSRFDSKFYATTIVSLLSQKLIHNSFEEFTGEECPIKNLRYLDYDFDGEEIMSYMYKILRTHSTEFLNKWSNVLNKLEQFNNTSSRLVGRGR